MKIMTTISTSIKYGNYQKYKKRALLIKEFIEYAEDYIRKEFDIKDVFEVRIRPIKGNVLGNCNKYGHIELDVRRFTFADCLITLSHELIHNEQYKTGRLVMDKGVNYWNGESINNKGTTYKAYRNQPWEAEAFDNQKQRLGNVMAEMVKDKDLERTIEEMDKEW